MFTNVGHDDKQFYGGVGVGFSTSIFSSFWQFS
jgi:hypothetical protein